MSELMLQVRDDKREFLLQLLREFDFVKIIDPAFAAEKMAVLTGTHQALKEVQKIEKGELPGKSVRQLVAEAA